ncbi:MAG: sugar phosphate isomerase/epimerase family protein [Acidimicrobiales bacterium]
MSPTALIASHYTIAGAGLGQPSRFPLEERCTAAAKAGFTGIGVTVEDYRALRVRRSPVQLAAAVAATDARVAEVELIHGWITGAPGAAAREQDAFEAAATFAADHVNVAEFAAAEDLPGIPAVVEHFAALCARAAERCDASLALEFLPWSGIPDLDAAVTIVREAGAPNACVLIDAYHFHHSGSDLCALAALPPGLVGVVQLDDGPADPPGGLRPGALARRPLLTGAFDLPGLAVTLVNSGFAGPWEVELFAPDQHALDVEAAAVRATVGLRELLASAGSRRASGPLL